ncbi:hypothetical protein Tco_0098007 [Tanacetum coccineum]
MVVYNQEKISEGSAITTDLYHTPTFIQPSPHPQKTQKPRKPKKKDTQVPQSSVPSDNVADEAVYKELDDSLVMAATTASSLEAEHDNDTCGSRITAALKSVKPKVKANVIEEPSIPVSASTKVSVATTTTATIPTPRKGIVIAELVQTTNNNKHYYTTITLKVSDKGKVILVEEHVKPKKKDLIRLDEENASKLQAEFDEEERLTREKDEANVV